MGKDDLPAAAIYLEKRWLALGRRRGIKSTEETERALLEVYRRLLSLSSRSLIRTSKEQTSGHRDFDFSSFCWGLRRLEAAVIHVLRLKVFKLATD